MTARREGIIKNLMATDPQPEQIWYDGNCHCAAIKFRFKSPPLETLEIMNCNCSICLKNGYLNIYPKLKDFEFVKGEDTMKDYEFASCRVAHKFCPNCGSTLFVVPKEEGNDMLVVNVCFAILARQSEALTMERYVWSRTSILIS